MGEAGKGDGRRPEGEPGAYANNYPGIDFSYIRRKRNVLEFCIPEVIMMRIPVGFEIVPKQDGTEELKTIFGYKQLLPVVDMEDIDGAT